MLIHQAALQQLAWLGRLPDIDVMRSAAENAMARRALRADDSGR
jgi:shikimate 5-dehydrogenase